MSEATHVPDRRAAGDALSAAILDALRRGLDPDAAGRHARDAVGRHLRGR